MSAMDGSFVLPAAPPIPLRLHGSGLLLGLGEAPTRDWVEVPASERAQLELVTEDRAQLGVELVDPSGEPIVGARLRLVREARGSGADMDFDAGEAVSDIDGRCRFERVPSGALLIVLPDGSEHRVEPSGERARVVWVRGA